MNPRAPLAITLALATAAPACRVAAVTRDAELREVGLFVPEAIGDEPPAKRVTVLHKSGRTTVMDDAVIRRTGPTLRLEKADAPGVGQDLVIEDVAAIEIERRATGDTAALMPPRRVTEDDAVRSSNASFMGGILAGLITFGLVALVVIESDQ